MTLRPSAPRQQHGAILALTLVIFLVMATLGVTIFTLSTTSSRLTNVGYSKARATASAEAGIHALYAQTAAAVDGGTALPTSVSGTLSSTVGSTTTTDGSYMATVTGTTTSGSSTTYAVQSVGLAPNGVTQSVVHAAFTRQVPVGGVWHFPNGSIVSNGPVHFGNSHTSTVDDSGGSLASVFSNGSVTLGNNTSLNGSVTAATTFSGSAGQVSGTVTTGQTTPFPTAAQLISWQAGWLSTGKSGTQYAACPSSGSTITAPAYINGDLSNNITVKPCPGSSSVVYVKGDISGDVYVSSDGTPLDGVTLVCSGTFTSQNLTEQNQPYTATVVTFDTNDLAFSNNSRGTIEGVIYAANAGFTFKNPGWTLNGTVIAGGSSGVSFGNGGGNAVVNYPGNSIDSSSSSFTFASQLGLVGNWVQTQ